MVNSTSANFFHTKMNEPLIKALCQRKDAEGAAGCCSQAAKDINCCMCSHHRIGTADLTRDNLYCLILIQPCCSISCSCCSFSAWQSASEIWSVSQNCVSPRHSFVWTTYKTKLENLKYQWLYSITWKWIWTRSSLIMGV